MGFAEFLDRLRAKDPDAFGVLSCTYGPAMVQAVSHRYPAQDEAFAEDATQEAFINVWRLVLRGALPVFPDARYLRGWLRTVVLRRAHEAFKRAGLAQPFQEGIEASIPDDKPVGLSLEDRELADCVRAAIRSLPDDLREVMELRYFHGKTLADIARELTALPVTIRARHHRAMLHLQQLFLGEFTDGEIHDGHEEGGADAGI